MGRRYIPRSKGDNLIEGGKKGKFSILLGKDGTPDWSDLDSFDDMHDVELYLTVHELCVDGREVESHILRIGGFLGK